MKMLRSNGNQLKMIIKMKTHLDSIYRGNYGVKSIESERIMGNVTTHFTNGVWWTHQHVTVIMDHKRSDTLHSNALDAHMTVKAMTSSIFLKALSIGWNGWILKYEIYD